MQVHIQFPSSTNTTTNLTTQNFLRKQSSNIHYSRTNITCKILINPFKTKTKTIISPTSPKLEPLYKPRTEPQQPQSPPPFSPLLPPPNHDQPTLNPFQRLAALTLDKIEKTFLVDQEKENYPLPKTVDPVIQLSGNYAPVHEHSTRTGLEVLGEIPPGLLGVYVRNGANPMVPPTGAHHLFDGDGMIHAVNLGPGNQASYCCRFTRTNRLVQEQAARKSLFPKPIGELHGRTGLIRLGLFYARAAVGLVDPTRGIGVANAGLVYFNGRLIAMSEDDLPYNVKIINGCDGFDHVKGVDLETSGRFDFDGQVNCPLIAHPKVDPTTGDLHTLSYDVVRKPYLKYFRFDKWGHKSCEVPVALPNPTMIHDFAMTQNFVVIPDNQVVFKLSEMIRGGSPLRFDPNKKARFGVLSKNDTDGLGIRWIEVRNSFCFHFMNAWEENEGQNIVIIGSCMSPPDSIFNGSDAPLQIDLCEIRLDLKTGKSNRRVIVPNMNLEIGQVNKYMLGEKTRYVYMAIAEPWPKCGGIAKVDVVTGEVTKFMYGHERYGGEPCFVPSRKPNNSINNNNNNDIKLVLEDSKGLLEDVDSYRNFEDEGWIMSFVRDENVERSELVILRAKDMKQIASVCMPSRVPYGFHGTFIDHKELSVQRNV